MTHKNLIVTLFPQRMGERGEAFVTNCEHKTTDRNIYITSNIQHWKKISKTNDWAHIMTSVLSHEDLHLVITKIESDRVSATLDNMFGDGIEYRREYHGLCKLDYHFYRKWNRRKK